MPITLHGKILDIYRQSVHASDCPMRRTSSLSSRPLLFSPKKMPAWCCSYAFDYHQAAQRVERHHITWLLEDGDNMIGWRLPHWFGEAMLSRIYRYTRRLLRHFLCWVIYILVQTKILPLCWRNGVEFGILYATARNAYYARWCDDLPRRKYFVV